MYSYINMLFVKKEEGGYIKGEFGGKFDMLKILMVFFKVIFKVLMKFKDEGKLVSILVFLKLCFVDCKNRIFLYCLSINCWLVVVVVRVVIEVEIILFILLVIFV